MYEALLDRIFENHIAPEKIAIFIISTFIAITVGIIYFTNIDNTPASPKDFEELHEKIMMVQENPESLLTQNGRITILDDKIIYEVNNKECSMTAEYTLDYKVISITQKDSSISFSLDIMLGIITIILAFFFSVIALSEVAIIFGSIGLLIVFIYRKIKKAYGGAT